MGVGALLLAMEARAHLESEGDSSEAEAYPSEDGPGYARHWYRFCVASRLLCRLWVNISSST